MMRIEWIIQQYHRQWHPELLSEPENTTFFSVLWECHLNWLHILDIRGAGAAGTLKNGTWFSMKGDIYWNGFGVKTNNCIVLQDGCPGTCSNEIIVSTAAFFCLWCCQLEGFLRNSKPMVNDCITCYSWNIQWEASLDITIIIVCIKNIFPRLTEDTLL